MQQAELQGKSPGCKQNEKKHLLKERDQILCTLGETKQNLTGLCQQVCREAALSREQIQILAKYSSSECPLSFLIPEKDQRLLQCESMVQSCQGFAEGSPSVAAAAAAAAAACHPEDEEYNYKLLQTVGSMPPITSEKALLVKHSSQSGITDFCQQMTNKCTTDE
ncbi:hypothetical protein FKM82_019911 [Ascaphus truei]